MEFGENTSTERPGLFHADSWDGQMDMTMQLVAVRNFAIASRNSPVWVPCIGVCRCALKMKSQEIRYVYEPTRCTEFL